MNTIEIRDNNGIILLSQDNISSIEMWYVHIEAKPQITITTKTSEIVYVFNDEGTADSFYNIVSHFVRGSQNMIIDCTTSLKNGRKYINTIQTKKSIIE